jgi:hypothetical protein
LLQHHHHKNKVTSPKTITTINTETVQKLEQKKPQASGSTVELVHGSTSATSTLHTHIHEGKTVVNNSAIVTGASHPVEKPILNIQTRSVQPIKTTENHQSEWFVTQQSKR